MSSDDYDEGRDSTQGRARTESSTQERVIENFQNSSLENKFECLAFWENKLPISDTEEHERATQIIAGLRISIETGHGMTQSKITEEIPKYKALVEQALRDSALTDSGAQAG